MTSSQSFNEDLLDLADPEVTSPLFTPLNYKDHSRLPPIYYQVAGVDPWRDSAILYANLLRQAACQTKIEVYPGVPHCWWAVYPQLSITKKWASDTVEGVRWLLKQGASRGHVSSRL
jgi:acetyl esterase/lipase